VWTFPVFLDRAPELTSGGHGASILLTPLGDGVVLQEMRQRFARMAGSQPVVVTPFTPDERYVAAIREACPDVEAVEDLASFQERLYTYQPSDRLLLIDASCFLADPDDAGFAAFVADEDRRTIKHLIVPGNGVEGTAEYVDADADGRIRSIQRCYHTVSWSFTSAVAATLVPVATLRAARERPLGDLENLRLLLSAEGVATRDVVLDGGALNLLLERNLLAVNEAAVLRHVSATGTSPAVGRNARIHPSARIIGPVVVQEGAEIDAGVTLIGPTTIGRGTRVELGATVAQSVVGGGQVVAAGTTLRHRVVLPQHGPAGAEDATARTPAETEDLESGWDPFVPLKLGAEVERPSPYAAVKRAIDIMVSGTALVLLAPFWLLMALLIKLDSPGPVHFRHEREGMGGRPFGCLKFRTMVPNADQLQRKLALMNAVDGPQFKIARDPRRTRVGHILSNTNLDELPQLWNVFRGDMSLVGPRPSPFRENQVCVPWRAGRLSVRPGMTGMWQICRHDRDRGDFHQWIQYDLLYVRHMSLWLDLKIILLTPVSMLRGGYVKTHWLVSEEKESGAVPADLVSPRA
jgi:lipopolysaccharide/colanic/teichoic acid biosynthesis glycosyltransferase